MFCVCGMIYSSVASHWPQFHCYKQAPSWYDPSCLKFAFYPNKQTHWVADLSLLKMTGTCSEEPLRKWSHTQQQEENCKQNFKFSEEKSVSRQSKNFSDRWGDGYANVQPNAMVIHTIDLISVIFPMHPYLIELICGSYMNMMLNHFCVCFCILIFETLLDISF